MRPTMLLTVICFSILPITVFGKTEFKYERINQGNWAVVLVRGMNLDVNRELVKIEDFTTILTEKGIAPKDGWKVNEKLAYEDFVVTLSEALLAINARKEKEKAGSFNEFLGFLENKVGISIAQLLANLPKNENFRVLSEGFTDYLAQKESSNTDNTSRSLTTGNQAGSKTKTGSQQSAQLAAVSSTISSLAQASTVYSVGEANPDYWNIFSKPASPILPGL